MQHTIRGDQMVVRLDRGEEVVETLTGLFATTGVAAASLTGIGAVRDTELGYYDLATKSYRTRQVPEVCELLGLVGNVALVEGDPSRPFVHGHVTLGTPTFEAIGGHLVRATVAVTVEVVVTPLPGALSRRLDPEVGLRLLDL